MQSKLILISALLLSNAGCGDDKEAAGSGGAAGSSPSTKSASATLAPTPPATAGAGGAGGAAGAAGSGGSAGANTAKGTVTFTPVGAQVKVTVSVSNVPPGVHGFHIHTTPACGNAGMEAGGHWDPAASAMHGEFTAAQHHGGDIGNITVDATGAGTKELTTDAWSIGTGAANDVVGHAVILHAMPDDFMTQPTGNAGGRIACGIIQAVP